jgi:glycosyltransferase involved in cell wall biosynthesis
VLVVNNSDNVSFEGVTTLFCESNGTASRPRNVGLENARGEFICFVDSDDMVVSDYVATVLETINTRDFDYCLFSWKFRHGAKIIIEDNPPHWNCSVWNCIYKRELIGDVRFDEGMKIAEDLKFNQMVRKGRKANITKVLYIYTPSRKGGLTWNATQ